MTGSVLILVNPDGTHRGMTHATDCTWALGCAANGQNYQPVARDKIAATTGRCSHCGGGMS